MIIILTPLLVHSVIKIYIWKFKEIHNLSIEVFLCVFFK